MRLTARSQRRLLGVGGSVAAVAGMHQVLTGRAGVLHGSDDHRQPNVDSELRFYAAWYVTSGLLMVRAARTPSREVIRLLGFGWGLGAVGRVLSLRAQGRPHPIFLALGAAELLLAGALLPPPQTRAVEPLMTVRDAGSLA